MKFVSLASSSSANAYTLSDGKTKILIECGLKYSALQTKMEFGLSKIDGCIVTHEHDDHSRSIKSIIGNGIPVYISYGSAVETERKGTSGGIGRLNIIEAGVKFEIGTLEILPFDTYHDVDESLGFFIRSKYDGEKMMFATDTVNVDKAMDGLDIIAIECNHDPKIAVNKKEWLQTKKPPHWESLIKVIERISKTHMSIDMCERYLTNIDLSRCREIHLMHLSGNYADEYNFVNRIRSLCGEHISVQACQR